MKHEMNKKMLITVLTTALLVVGCTKEPSLMSDTPQELRFETFIDEGGKIQPVAMSRTLTNNPLSNGYWLNGLLSTVDYPAATAYERLMWNVAMNTDGSYKSSSTKYFWAEGNAATRHSFIAYSAVPTASTGTTIAAPVGGTSAQPIPSVVYTHTSDPAKQMDLLYADNAKNIVLSNGAPAVKLIFKHRLARVVVKLIGTGGVTFTNCQAKIAYTASTVRSVATLPLSNGAPSLSDTYHSGTYNLGSSFSLPSGATTLATAVEVGDVILIPQNIAQTWATLTLSYIPDGGVTTKTASVELPALDLSAATGKQYDVLVNVIEESQNLSIASVTLTPWNQKTATIDPDIDIQNPPTPSQYVTIGTLRWAKGNLVAAGTAGSKGAKVGESTDYGLYFHRGSLVGWSGGSSGNGAGQGTPVQNQWLKPKGYNGSASWPAGYAPSGGSTDSYGYTLPVTDDAKTGIGDPCRYYLGNPWRTPTANEYRVLCNQTSAAVDNSFTWSAVGGSWQASPTPGGYLASNKLFFPAAGYREGGIGSLGTYGCYVSSSKRDNSNALQWYFNSSNAYPMEYRSYYRGYSVRCVAPV